MQLLNRARSADSKTFFKNFLSALAEPTEVPLTQEVQGEHIDEVRSCLLYTSPSPRDRTRSRMPSSA